jgi:hypothetical protein
LAREFHPKGIHVVHLIVDGQIDTPELRARPKSGCGNDDFSDSIAGIVLSIKQRPDAWTHELDLRSHLDSF